MGCCTTWWRGGRIQAGVGDVVESVMCTVVHDRLEVAECADAINVRFRQKGFDKEPRIKPPVCRLTSDEREGRIC